MSLSLFIALPLPFKIAAIVLGGLFWTGIRVQQAEVEIAPVEIVEDAAEKKADGPRVQVAVPEQGKRAPVVEAIKLEIDQAGNCQIDGKKTSKLELTKALAAEAAKNPGRRVLIIADTETPYQQVVDMLDLCKKSGLANVSFAVKPEEP